MAKQIQLRHDTPTNWTSVNPVLAIAEMGVEIGTNFYKIGDGVSTWQQLPYAILRTLDEINVVQMNDQATPSVPDANKLKLYAKKLSGRMMIRAMCPSGLSTPLQPSFFQNYIFMLSTGSGPVITALGGSNSSTGTITHPVNTETIPYMVNQVTAATANSTAGVSAANTTFMIGSTRGGFFYSTRLFLPDASYDGAAASQGSRVFSGLTNNTLAIMVAADAHAPAVAYIGFHRIHNGSTITQANWIFATRNGTIKTEVDTGVAFLPNKIYDTYIFNSPGSNVIHWRIDNLTDDITSEGSTSDTLPAAGTLLRCGVQLGTVNAVARNLRWQRIYCESDI